MNNIVEMIILGAIQGATEFLPISSSGHLVIFKGLLGINSPGMSLEILLHLGTLVAICAVFWKDIYLIIKDVRSSTLKLLSKKRLKDILKEDQYTKIFLLLLLGTVPTGIIGVSFENGFERLFNMPLFASIMIVITGTILWFTRLVKKGGKETINPFEALIIGAVQGIAITPGISRSGITIATASFMGIERGLAGRFSFLLSIPAIIGAMILRIKEAAVSANDLPPGAIIGAFIAALVGYLSLRILVNIIKRGKFYKFSYYCWTVGLIAAILLGICL